ncbi:MAG: efflux RND transporter permease subunit [bacterium]
MSAPAEKGAIAWMTKNPVAANLLMICILVGGMIAATSIRQQVFPEFYMEVVNVRVVYPGASPEEVENGIINPVEEAVREIEDVKHVTSTALEGMGTVSVEFLSGIDRNRALSDVKNKVDSLQTLPEEAEKPDISLAESRRPVIKLILYGDLERKTLREEGERIRDDLLQLDKVTSVDLGGAPRPEISIEISQQTLRKYNLTLSEVAERIRRSARDISGGSVITEGGEILLRVKERKEFGSELWDIPVVSNSSGGNLKLGEIATINDELAETDEASFYNGKPSVNIKVFREGDQTPIEVADSIKKYMKSMEGSLPAGLKVTAYDDRSEIYRDRISLLLKNAALGLVLVLLLLGTILQPRLAFWVTLGIPISFMGALLLMPSFNISINMVSLFAFIIAIGIVVDDAVIVGEYIYTLRNRGMPPVQASIAGTKRLVVPVTFAVLTNILAFSPLLFVEGVMGKIFYIVPIVGGLAFAFSLVEAFFILPAHLAHSKAGRNQGRVMGGMARIQDRVAKGLERFIKNVYRPFLERGLRNRYLAVAIGVAVLLATVGYMRSGYITMDLAPEMETDEVVASIELPLGSPAEDTKKVQDRVIKAAEKVFSKHGGEDIYEGIFSHIGASGRRGWGGGGVSQGHAAEVRVILVPLKNREFSGEQFANWWREETGRIPGLEKLRFQVEEMGPPVGAPVNVELKHRDNEVLESAAASLADTLRKYPQAKDVDDGFSGGKPQFDFKLSPEAYGLGLTPATVGRQIRARYYGAEALRLQRGRNEIKVMVRYPEEEREQMQSLEDLLIQTPGGGLLPLDELTTIKVGSAYNQIEHLDGRRVLEVTAKTTSSQGKGKIMNLLNSEVLPDLQNKYPGLSSSMGGEQREISESMTSLLRSAALALIVIFVLLGFVFRSYIQPLIIMSAIPFGVVGALIGHIIMGYNFSIISLMGIAALSGVVINDSLLLIDFANERRREGASIFEAAAEAGHLRFRPVILTTFTTFLGLSPMIFETSMQARMMIPMAISLGFGLLFSTMIILVLVPCFYLIVEDLKKLFTLKHKQESPETATAPPEDETA